jgi:trigger factor
VIHEIKRKELPELDDEFAGEVSEFDTLDEYKADLRAKLSETKQQQATTENENNVVEKVVSNASMEIPEAMIEEQVSNTLEDYARRMRSQGLTMEQYMQFTGMTEERLREDIRPQAEKRIRTRLVLEAIVAAENIEAPEDAVEAEIKKMADTYKMEPDRAKELLGEEGLQRMKEDLAVQEAVDFLVAEAKLV